MTYVLGNLPEGTTEKDIKTLMQHYHPSKIEFLNKSSAKHSSYECMVTLDISDPILASMLEQYYNKLCWKGTCISTHRLIF